MLYDAFLRNFDANIYTLGVFCDLFKVFDTFDKILFDKLSNLLTYLLMVIRRVQRRRLQLFLCAGGLSGD